jgi:RNA polymerase sigma factor for flagellar operon FliA
MLKKAQTAYSNVAHKGVVGCGCAIQDREALLEAHLPQVKFLAERLAAKLPPSVDRDDLIGAGVMGLLDAVDKFDPARGVQFKTYAELRVRGAMLDSLRSLEWVPRSLRQRARELEATYRRLEQMHGRPAEEEEVAAALGVSLAQLHDLLKELPGLTLLGLEGSEDEEGRHLAQQIPDDPARNPQALFELTEGRERLIKAIDRLPERERQVIALYYLEELTMKEVGAVLGITESRVSQLHTQAILRLRGALVEKRPVRQALLK